MQSVPPTDSLPHDDGQWNRVVFTRLLIIVCSLLAITGGVSGSIVAHPIDNSAHTVNVSSVEDRSTTVAPSTEAVTTADATGQDYSINITVTDSTGNTDNATIPITVSDSSTGDDYELARFDTNGNKIIDRPEAVDAVIAYNDDTTIGGESVERPAAVDVIIAYNTVRELGS